MNRIAESFKVNVMFENGVSKTYEIAFEDNIDITDKDFTDATEFIKDYFQKAYKEKTGAYFSGADINGKIFIIDIGKTCAVEFYI